MTLDSCAVERCLNNGIDLDSSTENATITGCRMDDNGGLAMANVPIEALAGLSGNTATGNGVGDYVRITSANAGIDLTIAPDNLLNGVLVSTGTIFVNLGRTMVLEPGVVVKWEAASSLSVSGFLDVNGTPSEPVVFTSLSDDATGGDTNKDGPSVGTPGSWRSIVFSGSGSGSEMDCAVIRFAGASGSSAIDLNPADVTLRDCLVEQCQADALELSTGSAGSTISGCRFDDNGGVAVDLVPLGAVAGFEGNTAQGNALGDHIRVTDDQLDTDVSIGRENLINGVLVSSVSIFVPGARRLTLHQGVAIKFESSTSSFNVNGALDVFGTAFDPVFLTALADDEVAGDTNLDGAATVPVPGGWRGIQYVSTADPSTAEHLVVRFAGANGAEGFDLDSAVFTGRALRAEHCLAEGIDAVAHAGDAANWVAFDCGGHGIELSGGSFDLSLIHI